MRVVFLAVRRADRQFEAAVRVRGVLVRKSATSLGDPASRRINREIDALNLYRCRRRATVRHEGVADIGVHRFLVSRSRSRLTRIGGVDFLTVGKQFALIDDRGGDHRIVAGGGGTLVVDKFGL
ncbi:hypothetical protein SAR116_1227 [Candidatus Puniceispirillum marinum IMCC1322]|uniref:Uncharacterized protein n=1 Tax=Puniceispirillum marinum (strain IMCC1322) TaxID=488538 RepID=D5BT73_PUNMI|nr:hypothetical protein SAR116_1227 [Candidatus Puniceispirillum marinum IMCC1322]